MKQNKSTLEPDKNAFLIEKVFIRSTNETLS